MYRFSGKRKCKGLIGKIKSVVEFLCFKKQVPEWTGLVKEKILQKCYSLSFSESEFLISLLQSPVSNIFVFTQSFINYFIHFFKFFSIFLADGAIYMLKQTHFFWNCNTFATISLYYRSLLQIMHYLTNSIRPLSCLSRSFLSLALSIEYLWNVCLIYFYLSQNGQKVNRLELC